VTAGVSIRSDTTIEPGDTLIVSAPTSPAAPGCCRPPSWPETYGTKLRRSVDLAGRARLWLFTLVYTPAVDAYRFDDDSYRSLGAADVPWATAVWLLRHARPVLRRATGNVLQLAGVNDDNRVLTLVMIEEGDDEYLVVAGRWAETEEAALIRSVLNRGKGQ